MSDPQIHVVMPDVGIDMLAGIRCKIASDATNNECTVLEVTLQAEQGAGLHVHQRESELVLVQSGTCTVGDAVQQWSLDVGGMAHFPKQTPHFFRNNGTEPCVLLITAMPGGLDRYFADVARAVQEHQPERITAINQQYKITFF